MGKVGHHPGKRYCGFEKDKSDHGPWKSGNRAFFGYAHGKSHHKMIWKNDKEDYLPWEAADVDDKGYPDAYNAESAVKQLQELSKEDKPFFLAVGFYKPHLPLNAPKKYWDLYEQDKLPVAKWQQKPIGVKPDWTFHHGTIKNYEPTTHYNWKWGKYNVPAEQGKKLRHAYSACVSYMDAQVGKVLDELKRLKLDDETIVVFWSDHGWHLGEHGIWGKFTLHEVSVRSPLIVRVPGQGNAGAKTTSLVETIDILPTLCDLAGIKYGKRFQGKSFAGSVLDEDKKARESALSDLPVDHGQRGWSIKTTTHRYTRWYASRAFKKIILEELYDHTSDPDETNNLAVKYSEALKRHQQIMDRRLSEIDLKR
jgi:iduronate 2-sulfatase